MKIFASPSHKFGQLTIHDGAMASSKSPIRSRHRCPHCGSPLFYINTAFTFLTGQKKRVCLAAKCSFAEQRRFKIVLR
jgi:ribosomal protein S14